MVLTPPFVNGETGGQRRDKVSITQPVMERPVQGWSYSGAPRVPQPKVLHVSRIIAVLASRVKNMGDIHWTR